MGTAKSKKHIAGVLAICLLFSSAFFSFTEEARAVPSLTVSERIAQIKKEKDTLQLQMEQTDAKIKSTQDELEEIAAQMALLNQELGYQQGLVDLYEEEVSTLRTKILEKTTQSEEQYASMVSLLRAIEESQNNNIWSIILSSRSFGDAIHDLQVYNDVIEYEKGVLDEYKREQASLQNIKATLQSEEAIYARAVMDYEDMTKVYLTRTNQLNQKIVGLKAKAADLQTAFSYYEIMESGTISGSSKYSEDELTSKEIEEYLTKAYEELETANVSEDECEKRLSMLKYGLDLVGKVPYWYGGRCYRPGWNSEWWQIKPIVAVGSSSYPYGAEFPYGLDCSGFVFWCHLTMYGKDSWESPVEWMAPLGAKGIYGATSHVDHVGWSQKLPGDIVVNEGASHTGLYLCENNEGKPLYLHCTGGRGVVVSTSSLCNFNHAAHLKKY